MFMDDYARSRNMSSILIIEDNPQTSRMVVKLLRRQGHTVDAVHTGEDGLLKVIDHLPDLILVDLGLPDIDGQTVIAIIRQRSDLVPTSIIAFTAWPPATAREMAKAYGCDGVITKPIDTRLFPQQIEAFLRQPSQTHVENESGRAAPQEN